MAGWSTPKASSSFCTRSVLPPSTISLASMSIRSAGIAAGATSAVKLISWKTLPVTPCSVNVLVSGSFFMRTGVGTAIGRPMPVSSTGSAA